MQQKKKTEKQVFKRNRFKEHLHEIIFEADTPMGKLFDEILIAAIIASVLVVMLESVVHYETIFGELFYILEWIFTIIFTIEYVFRLYVVYRPIKYATSFFGIIDLLSILPTYVSIFITGAQSLLVIRILRLLRIFRIFKLAHYLDGSQIIINALKSSRAKITVFLSFILVMVTIIGAIMYLVEGGQENSDFTSIPRSIYWAIVTLTTVGYGDITPVTEFGQFLSAIVMILGYSVIAVPTGIVSAEMARPLKKTNTQCCRFCGKEGHDDDALHCKYCGELINEEGNL